MRIGMELEALVRECLAAGGVIEIRRGHVLIHGEIPDALATRIRRRERDIVAAALGPGRCVLRCYRCPCANICDGRCRYDNQ